MAVLAVPVLQKSGSWPPWRGPWSAS